MRRAIALAAAAGIVVSVGVIPSSQVLAAGTSSTFHASKKVSRIHWDGDKNVVVDKRTVSVTVSQTQSLRDRQEVNVTWQGAHPTGGLVTDHNSAAAAAQEYPVVVMQCRGVDSSSAPVAKRVSPQTCWTQTPAERFDYSQSGFIYPSYRMDRYATTDQRAISVNEPDPLPPGCPAGLAADHWVPFRAANGVVYPGGVRGCAGMAPEAANAADSLQPGNTTYGVADLQGDGSTKFVIQTAQTNASLGCSETVACTLEIIPIEGISCDSAGDAPGANLGMPVADRPDPTLIPTVYQQCAQTGAFAAGEYNLGGSDPQFPVTGEFWWAASNWRDRISVPLSFAPSDSVCNIVSNESSLYVYGSEALAQATQQWSPHFCLGSKLFVLRHVQTSETQAKNLLNVGNVEAAVQAAPPDTPFLTPTVQAPVAASGFAIAFSADDMHGNPLPAMKLDARLLAKLLTESYRTCATCLDFTSPDAVRSGFSKLANNPIDITRDPEFQALNPNVPPALYEQSAATLAVMSSDSDVMWALTSYINADPEARAWLNGTPDSWGMVVNPAYKHIALPVTDWPLLDTHIGIFAPGSNTCLQSDPVPWLPLVASPVSNPAMIALDLQFDIANSQTNCVNNGQINQKLAAVGREQPGIRFLVGLVSLADARRYALNVARLQTTGVAPSDNRFTSGAGRTFVAPTNSSIAAAAKTFVPSKTSQSWLVPYRTLSRSAADAQAYPGTFLISVDIPTTGLPKSDARGYAELLRFTSTQGQQPGLNSGQLPPGYLPLTARNGLGAEADYALRAADAVEAQQGRQWPLITPRRPPPSSSAPPSRSTPTPVPTSSHPLTHSGTPGAGVPPVGAPATSPAGVVAPAAGSTATPSSSPSASSQTRPASGTGVASTAAVAQVAYATRGANSGPLGFVFPVLALLGLMTLLLAGWLSGVGRR